MIQGFNHINQYITNKFSKEYCINYLQLLLSNNSIHNNNIYDLIDYEQLIFIEQFYTDDEEIILLVKKIKKIITNNFIQKQKFINRSFKQYN